MTNKRIFWVVLPLALLAVIAGAIVALPGFVSSSSHRQTIEALATSLTGRRVHIAGTLSLSLFPQPQLIADDITIDGPHTETITAKSLTLDIAISALLHGRLTATSLILRAPVIKYPWPLPEGPAAVAPPRWLTTLHAQILNGQISFGTLSFNNVSADIFTGQQGAVSVSGSGQLGQRQINLTISLGAIDENGMAPLAVEAKTADLAAHLSGSFSTSNKLSAALDATATGHAWLSDASRKFAISGHLDADPERLQLHDIIATQGRGHVSGSVSLDLATMRMIAKLAGGDINIPIGEIPADMPELGSMVVLSALSLDQVQLGTVVLPHVQITANLSATGLDLAPCVVSLPANTDLTVTANVTPDGKWQGQAKLTTADLPDLLARLDLPFASNDGHSVTIAAKLTGSDGNLKIDDIAGNLGAGVVDGAALLDWHPQPAMLNAQLHFSQLDLLPVAAALRKLPGQAFIDSNFEISVDRGQLGGLGLSHVLFDGAAAAQVNIRRVSASLENGVFVGSFNILPGGDIAAAHMVLSVPSAAPLAPLIAAYGKVPSAVLNAPLSIGLSAAGPANALAATIIASLGQFSLTAAPVINLSTPALAGAFTLRHPSAIAAFKLFGLNAGLAWPGAGSLSLRSDVVLSQSQEGLPNFVVSLGNLTAAGRLIISNGDHIDGDIAADSLALPALQGDWDWFWKILPQYSGTVKLSANQVLIAGQPFLDASAGNMTINPGTASLTIENAGLAGGLLKGSIGLALVPPNPPSMQARLDLQNADLSAVSLPWHFPLSLPSGRLSGSLNLAATGYSVPTWAATLAGDATLQAQAGSLAGFDITALGRALGPPPQYAALKNAATTGVSPFDSLNIQGVFDHGIFKISTATLKQGSGGASASGSVDLSDQDAALNLTLSPPVTPPVSIPVAIIGPWSHTKTVPNLKKAVVWKPATSH